jgi:hypothetical protein
MHITSQNRWVWKGHVGSYIHTRVNVHGSKILIKASNCNSGKYLDVTINTKYNTIYANKIEVEGLYNPYDLNFINPEHHKIRTKNYYNIDSMDHEDKYAIMSIKKFILNV